MTSSSSRPKVLIVDDIPENLTVLENVLRELDVDIHKAGSGNEALKATLYDDYSLILLDLLMPGMNGLEVAEMLKQDEATATIPIIFITAIDKDEQYELKAYSKGAVDFIYKPFNRVVLLNKVKILLELYAMNTALKKAILHSSQQHPKILVVDDNSDNILVLKKLLSRLEADIVTATSGNEALTTTIYNDFAVIFLDVQMPEMDGYEVAELLKSNDKTAGIPIIFITAIDRNDAKEIKGYNKGAVDFIFKPFNEFILLSKARIFLEMYALKAGLGSLVTEKTAALKESNKQLKAEIQQKEIIEKELLQTRSYLSSVVNSLSSLLIGVETGGLITDMNMEAVRVSGVSAEDAKGKQLADIFPLFSGVFNQLLELAKSNEPVEMPNIPIESDAISSIYSFALYPLVGDNVDQFVIRIDDVTEARRMEEELNQRRHIESLGQLAGGIAHDFNNMLGAISGSAEMLRIKTGDNPELESLFKSIFTSVERSADLSSKLLSFARKKGGRKTTVDIHRLIGDTVSILRRSIDKRIDIVVKKDASRFNITGDESELHNALLNLGINARDAMPEGGTLTISTQNRQITDSAYTRSRELRPGDYLEVCVSDSGIGMSESVQKKVFEPFFTTKPHGKGTGLGLASVYGTMQAHAGSIQLDSTVGKGSTITLLLPVASRTSESVVAPRQSSEEKINGTALLVDDEEVIRKVGAELLKQLGMQVIQAGNGREAIEIFREQKDTISLIILDVIMPEMNGRDCFEEIKKISPEAKVILCSGYAPDEMIVKLHMEGVDNYIRKPFRLNELRNVILTCMKD